MKYIFIILFLPSILVGEELTLHDCIRIAQSKSLRAKNIELNKKQAEYAHTAFNAQYLPQLSLNGDIPGYTNRIQEESFKGESYLQSYETWRSSLNLQINQIIPFTGGYLGVSSGLSRTDNFGTIENSHWLSNPVVITYNQPIFAVNNYVWDKRIEDIKYKKIDNEFIENMESLAIETSHAFFAFFVAKMDLKNAEINLANNDTLYNLNQSRYKVGKIAENDLLQSELAFLNSQNSLEKAKLSFNETFEKLKILLIYQKINHSILFLQTISQASKLIMNLYLNTLWKTEQI